MLTPGITGAVLPGLTLIAWALFEGSTGTIRKSAGIASITRTGLGTYTVVFLNAQANSTYIVKCDRSSLNAELGGFSLSTTGFTAQAATSAGGVVEFVGNYFAVYG